MRLIVFDEIIKIPLKVATFEFDHKCQRSYLKYIVQLLIVDKVFDKSVFSGQFFMVFK